MCIVNYMILIIVNLISTLSHVNLVKITLLLKYNYKHSVIVYLFYNNEFRLAWKKNENNNAY